MKRLILALAVLALIPSLADAQPVRRALRKALPNLAPPVCAPGQDCVQATLSVQVAPAPAAAPAAPKADRPVVGVGRVIGLKAKLQIVRKKVIAGLVAKGVSEEDAKAVVGQLGDGQLLKWLIENFDDILAIVLKLLPLFLEDGKVSF